MSESPPTQPSGTLRLTKYQGAGNDFLVIVDMTGDHALDPDEVRWLCDRHHGIGADGVMRVSPGGAAVGARASAGSPATALSRASARSRAAVGGAALCMELRNADGSVAEMSGNGIRCLVQAAVDVGIVEPGSIGVSTAAGLRLVDYRVTGRASGFASVDMGEVSLGGTWDASDDRWPRVGEAILPDAVPFLMARLASVGNPHLVVVLASRPDADVLYAHGPAIEKCLPGGTNLELVWPAVSAGSPLECGDLELVVWERGAGATLACGTGTCAAVAVVHDAGMCASDVRVRNPGGVLEVHLEPGEVGGQGSGPEVSPAYRARLGGPSVRVGEILAELPPADALRDQSLQGELHTGDTRRTGDMRRTGGSR